MQFLRSSLLGGGCGGGGRRLEEETETKMEVEQEQLIVAPLNEDVDTTPCRQDFTVESRGLGKLRSQSRSQSAPVCL